MWAPLWAAAFLSSLLCLGMGQGAPRGQWVWKPEVAEVEAPRPRSAWVPAPRSRRPQPRPAHPDPRFPQARPVIHASAIDPRFALQRTSRPGGRGPITAIRAGAPPSSVPPGVRPTSGLRPPSSRPRLPSDAPAPAPAPALRQPQRDAPTALEPPSSRPPAPRSPPSFPAQPSGGGRGGNYGAALSPALPPPAPQYPQPPPPPPPTSYQQPPAVNPVAPPSSYDQPPAVNPVAPPSSYDQPPAVNPVAPPASYDQPPAVNPVAPPSSYDQQPAVNPVAPPSSYDQPPAVNPVAPPASYDQPPAVNPVAPPSSYDQQPAVNPVAPPSSYDQPPAVNPVAPPASYDQPPAVNPVAPPSSYDQPPAVNPVSPPASYDQPAIAPVSPPSSYDQAAVAPAAPPSSYDQPAIAPVAPPASYDQPPAVNPVAPPSSYNQPAVNPVAPPASYDQPAVNPVSPPASYGSQPAVNPVAPPASYGQPAAVNPVSPPSSYGSKPAVNPVAPPATNYGSQPPSSRPPPNWSPDEDEQRLIITIHPDGSLGGGAGPPGIPVPGPPSPTTLAQASPTAVLLPGGGPGERIIQITIPQGGAGAAPLNNFPRPPSIRPIATSAVSATAKRKLPEAPSLPPQSEGVCNYDKDCWTMAAQVGIANGVMYKRETGFTCEQCVNLCAENQKFEDQNSPYVCKSMSYDHRWNICDLYAVEGDAAPRYLTKYPGRDYFKPNSACNFAANANVVAKRRKELAKSVQQASLKAAALAELSEEEEEEEKDDDHGDRWHSFAGRSFSAGAPAAAEPKKGPSCDVDEEGKEQTAVYNRFDNLTNPQAGDIFILDVTSEVGCAKACDASDDSELKGQMCMSFTFAAGECLIGTSTIGNAYGRLLPVDGEAYYEKQCIPLVQAAKVDRFWRMVPQKILVGHVQAVETVPSLRRCQMACLTADFNCQSAMYYPEDEIENCLLNSDSEVTKPELFVDESLAGAMVYIEPQLTPKQRAIQQSRFKFNRIFRDINHDVIASRWTMWSSCLESKNGLQHRYLKCKDEIQQKNIRSCPKQSRICRDRNFGREAEVLVSDDECRALRSRAGTKYCPHGRRKHNGTWVSCSDPVDCPSVAKGKDSEQPLLRT